MKKNLLKKKYVIGLICIVLVCLFIWNLVFDYQVSSVTYNINDKYAYVEDVLEEATEEVTKMETSYDGEEITLNTGNYVVGIDIEPGTYDVEPISGYDNVEFGSKRYTMGFNQFDPNSSTTINNVKLHRGQKVVVGSTGMGVSIKLHPNEIEEEVIVEEAKDAVTYTEQMYVSYEGYETCYIDDKETKCSKLKYKDRLRSEIAEKEYIFIFDDNESFATHTDYVERVEENGLGNKVCYQGVNEERLRESDYENYALTFTPEKDINYQMNEVPCDELNASTFY